MIMWITSDIFIPSKPCKILRAKRKHFRSTEARWIFLQAKTFLERKKAQIQIVLILSPWSFSGLSCHANKKTWLMEFSTDPI